MESSTIVRILEIPTGGIDPSELSSGSLLYVENVGTDGLGALYYAGGDDGHRRATYIKQVTSVPGSGTQVVTDNSTVSGDGTILSPLKAIINSTDAFVGSGSTTDPLGLALPGLSRSTASILEGGNNIIVNYNNLGSKITISSIPPAIIDGGSS
jgi:hypothetical protein